MSGAAREGPVPPALVLVVDDDPSAREGMEGLLRAAGHRVVAFASAQAFLDYPPPDGPCCLVLDLRLPGPSGLDLQAHLAAANRDVPIVFVTGDGDIPTTVRAMRAGAVEFLTKPLCADALLEGIGRALERSRAARALDAEMRDLRARYEGLTARERDVMALVTEGLLNKQVAARLGIQEVTVKVHRGRLMAKMAAPSLVALARMAERLRASPSPPGGIPRSYRPPGSDAAS